MTDDTEAREIARGLTKAQREALMRLPADGEPSVKWACATGTREALLRKRLVARWMATRSAEDWRADPDPSWKSQYGFALFDAHSLTMRRPSGYAQPPHGKVSGQEVRAILMEQET